MAIELSRTGMMQAFTQRRSPNRFLSRLFTFKPGNAFRGEKVFIDIQRTGEDVSIVVTHGTGPRLNDADKFVTKEIIPPSYGEAVAMNVNELYNRMLGVDPHTAAYQEYAAQLIAELVRRMAIIDDKIKRAVELQASQILQTGVLDLKDDTGTTLYSLDFLPKATHFPTSSIVWGQVGDDKIGDVEALCDVIRNDGAVDPDMLIFGKSALREFLDDASVQDKLDNRRIDLGQIRPEMRDSGAKFYGFVWVGTYQLEIWAYADTYKDPQTGLPTRYINDGSVIVLSSSTRLDKVGAEVPLPVGPDPRIAGLIPGRLTSTTAAADDFDVTPNIYCTPNGKQIMGELESRPCCVPVQIDGFGCLDTGL